MEQCADQDGVMLSSDNAVEGIFGLWKPLGMSSQRAVQKVKFWARDRTGDKKIRVGHGGTLDPLAQGVLVIAVGRTFTRQIDAYVCAAKEYVADVTFGITSETGDAEGPLVEHEDTQEPDLIAVEAVVNSFIGDIDQVPPAYSAIKIDGQEAYKRVRRGEDVVMRSRTVHIDEIEVVSYVYPVLRLRVVCGKGTYMRSLVRDIGDSLGVGAYMSALTRTRVGRIEKGVCRRIDDFLLG